MLQYSSHILATLFVCGQPYTQKKNPCYHLQALILKET